MLALERQQSRVTAALHTNDKYMKIMRVFLEFIIKGGGVMKKED